MTTAAARVPLAAALLAGLLLARLAAAQEPTAPPDSHEGLGPPRPLHGDDPRAIIYA
jgi:hypothetical protein